MKEAEETVRKIGGQVLEDLWARFVRMPKNTCVEIEFMLQLEEAWWFYKDFIDQGDHPSENGSASQSGCLSVNTSPAFDDFTRQLLTYFSQSDVYNCKEMLCNVETILERFNHYKATTPKSGVFLLNKEKSHLLMVKERSSGKLGIPKGKADLGESLLHCAIRECEEETGINCSMYICPAPLAIIKKDRHYVVFVAPSSLEISDPLPKPSHHLLSEITSLVWMPVQDIQHMSKKMFNFSVNRYFLKKLKDWLGNHS